MDNYIKYDNGIGWHTEKQENTFYPMETWNLLKSGEDKRARGVFKFVLPDWACWRKPTGHHVSCMSANGISVGILLKWIGPIPGTLICVELYDKSASADIYF